MDDKIPIDYSGVVLNEFSSEKLMRRFRNEIPENWDIITKNHHVFLSEGKIPEHLEKFLGLSVGMWVKEYAKERGVFVVSVDGIELLTDKPYIVVATDKSFGGNYKNIDKTKSWVKISKPLKLVGKISEVPNQEYVSLLKLVEK